MTEVADKPVEGFKELYDAYQVIMDADAPQEEIDKRCAELDYDSLLLLAGESSSSKILQSVFSIAESKNIWMELSQNPNTPVDILRALSNYKDAEIVYAVTLNPNTPQDVLIALSSHPKAFIRSGAALHPKTPLNVLYGLLEDDSEIVHMEAVKALTQREDSVFSSLPRKWNKKLL